MSKGYFYIVTGKKYRDEMLVSFQQLRQHTKLPICIASDEKPAIECDHFIHITDPKFTYQDKVLNLDRTPFDETIYVDSDISFFHCPDDIFDGLGGADLLASHEASLGLGPVSQKANIPNAFPEVSSGLIAYRKSDAVMEMLKNWRAEYDSLYARHGIKADQPSFRRALFHTNIKFSILPPEYHYIPANFTRLVGPKVYCIHNHSFDFARKLGNTVNTRPMGDYSAYVDGLGVFRNPYAMQFKEVLNFNARCLRLLPYLLFRAGYISLKHKWWRKKL
jgi:hypothetical protein